MSYTPENATNLNQIELHEMPEELRSMECSWYQGFYLLGNNVWVWGYGAKEHRRKYNVFSTRILQYSHAIHFIGPYYECYGCVWRLVTEVTLSDNSFWL